MLQKHGFSIVLATAAVFQVMAPGDMAPVVATATAGWPIVENAPLSHSFGAPQYPPLPEGAILLETVASPTNPIDQVTELLNAIDRARGELNPDTLPDLVRAETEVVKRMAAVESYFDRSTNSSNKSAWLRYLTMGPLMEAIENEESIARRGRPAVELESRLRGIHTGLELAPLVNLRTAVQHYIAALRYSDPKRGLASINKQLDALSDLFAPEEKSKKGANPESSEPIRSPRPLSELSAEDVAQLERLLGGLSDANQATALVSQIRSHFSKPNLRGWVDGRTITDALSRPINNPNDVNDCILGTRMLGRARITGHVTSQLLPSDQYVRLMVRMDGTFTSTARGFHKPITLDTTGLGKVYAARQFAITEKGITLGETIATADLSTQIRRINHPLKLVRKIALRKAAEQRPLAEAISSNKLRDQTLEGFDEQTAEAAKREFPSIDEAITPWFLRLDFPTLTRSIGSTSEAVYSRANLQRPFGLAALAEPPPLATIRSVDGEGVHPGGYFSAVQVHQSVLDNTIVNLLAGQTLSPAKINELVAALGIPIPAQVTSSPAIKAAVTSTGVEPLDLDIDDLSVDDVVEAVAEAEPPEEFEVDLHDFRPVFVEAVDQSLRIGLRGTRFSQGDREISRTLEVAATYRPVISDGAMWLIRDEEVDLSFPGTRRLTISQTAIKTNMEKSFNDLFPKELLHRSFPMPPSVKLPTLAGRVLKVSAIDFTDGWISIALR